jgi:N-acetylmuramoyl-L-alanine amidase
MRPISYIVIHCTAAPAQQRTSDIISYWKNKLGWNKYGYHQIVSEDGTAEHITPDEEICNGVKGYNANSIHLCYKGGWNGSDTRTDAQKRTLLELVRQYKAKYPKAVIKGHRDLSPDLNHDGKITPNEWIKKCPCFDAGEEYGNVV